MNTDLDNFVLLSVGIPVTVHCEDRDVFVDCQDGALNVSDHMCTSHDELESHAVDDPFENEACSTASTLATHICEDVGRVGNASWHGTLVEVDLSSVVAT